MEVDANLEKEMHNKLSDKVESKFEDVSPLSNTPMGKVGYKGITLEAIEKAFKTFVPKRNTILYGKCLDKGMVCFTSQNFIPCSNKDCVNCMNIKN